MAVLPMKKISIYGLNRNRKDILELLQRKNCVEISKTKIKDDEIFSKMDTSNAKSMFDSSQKSLENAVKILENLVKPETSLFSMFEGRQNISLEKYRETEKNASKTVGIAKKIIALDKKITDEKADITKNEIQISSLEFWQDLDISMRIKGTENTSVFLGTLPNDYTKESIDELFAKNHPQISAVEVEIISHSKLQTCIFVVCHKKYSNEIENSLRSIGFSYPVNPSKKSPIERIAQLKERNSKLFTEIEDLTKEILEFQDMRESLLFTYDYFSARIEKYEVLEEIPNSKNSFIINGFIPQENCEDLKAELEKNFDCYIEIFEPNQDEDIPVKLKNNDFAGPIEGVIESYSLPNKHEFDPSTFTAIFYYFLFGLMLSDLAYGLIMAIGCGVVLSKFKNMEDGLRKSIKMFMYCGISTAFWGLMFGSFFGDAIEVVSTTFFGNTIVTPCLWFRPLNEPMTLLMFSLLLGIIHLFVGLALKFYMLVKDGKILDAVYDVLFWYFLVGGAIIYFMSMKMFLDISGLGFTLPTVVGNIGGAFAIIGAIGIVFTAGRESRKPAIRIMKGLYGLYGATSYLSDILSYSRLLALGLATGVIASVFNQIGAMGGNNIFGIIMFILVFAVGHSFNIGLNLLGAYVHSNRLEFVEFFGKFYEGGGRKFLPFSQKTKYFKLDK